MLEGVAILLTASFRASAGQSRGVDLTFSIFLAMLLPVAFMREWARRVTNCPHYPRKGAFFLLSSRNVRFHICTEACSDREGYVAIFSPTYFLGEGETLTKKIARTGCFLGGFLAMLVYVYTWDSLIIHHCTLGFLSEISLGGIYYSGGP